jgi:metallophosphoesterase (TIGR03768 family)
MRTRAFRLIGLGLALMLQLQLAGCGGWDPTNPWPVEWPIAEDVFTTAQQQILPVPLSASAPPLNPADVPLYEVFGYSAWERGAGTNYGPDPADPQPYLKRTDLAPDYAGAPNVARLLSFFSMSDIHIADKESPAQPIDVGWSALYGASTSCGSAWSPIVVATTHVLDAAVQTINALHRQSPFDFGISLGDDANNTQYNELRWFIDVLDGQVITPSSGAHDGDRTIDYQRPYRAAGLNKTLRWFAVIGNHDQFWMGSAYEDIKTMQAHVGNTVLNMDDNPDPSAGGVNTWGDYMGVVDGWAPLGTIIKEGPENDYSIPPTVVPDPNRHSLATSSSSSLNWMREFFTTTSEPVGHGFTQDNLDNDFACYSFEPKSDIPIKVIALDDTCKGDNQPNYAEACLDENRLHWLEDELQEGQDNGKLMIIAAHIPVYPQQTLEPTSGNYPLFSSTSIIDDLTLLALLHNYPNLILWMSGHRHVNVVTSQPSPDPINHPEQSFWEVETSSLRDFPQQFRTFDIRRNSDNTISIFVTDVDPAVSPGSPAAKSRGYAVAAGRIFGTPPTITDNTSHAYNAELVKQLTPEMQAKIAHYGSPIEATGD